MGYIGAQIYDIVEPQSLELSNIKHLMSEWVQNFMLALHPSLLVTWSLDAAEGVPVSAWQNFVFEANTLKSCVLLTVIWKHHWFGLFQLGLRKSLFCTVKMAHCAEKAFVKREGQRIISFRIKLFLKIFLLLTFFVFCSGHKKPWKLFLRSGYAGSTNISGSYGFDIFWVFISFS